LIIIFFAICISGTDFNDRLESLAAKLENFYMVMEIDDLAANNANIQESLVDTNRLLSDFHSYFVGDFEILRAKISDKKIDFEEASNDYKNILKNLNVRLLEYSLSTNFRSEIEFQNVDELQKILENDIQNIIDKLMKLDFVKNVEILIKTYGSFMTEARKFVMFENFVSTEIVNKYERLKKIDRPQIQNMYFENLKDYSSYIHKCLNDLTLCQSYITFHPNFLKQQFSTLPTYLRTKHDNILTETKFRLSNLEKQNIII